MCNRRADDNSHVTITPFTNSSLTLCVLKDFQGAIVAITHNPAFAASLNATHILRVADGNAVLADKIGELSDADFDHERPKPVTSTKKVCLCLPVR